MNVDHELKIAPEYFEAVRSGVKTFEIRNNDRNFQVGQQIVLKEFNDNKFTGEYVSCVITYITAFAQRDGYVVFGFTVGSVEECE